RHEIEDYVRYLDRVAERVLDGPTPPASLTVLGFSQGVATAARWTVSGRLRPRRLVLWGDFLPPDLDLARAREAWSRTQVILVRGHADPALGDPRLTAEEAGRIRSAGLSVDRRAYAGGHDVDPDVLRAIADADDRAPTSADPGHSGTPANDT
ncbi:MAG TPA: hypothetical protein VK849_00850, partial [Longimicrobiales bacterium]|nr:hypothetical protein [Longimicrobiales bacterium]